MASSAPLYPVSLVVSGRGCLVVGGGTVAARKVEGLLDCGAWVTVVAPEVGEAVHALGTGLAGTDSTARLTIETRPYRSPEAADYRLVVTATGHPEVDHAVFADADAAGVWVNSADDVGNCSVLLPAVHRAGTVTVAVSTGGASPTLARWLRTRAAATLDFDVAVVAELLDEARSLVKETGRSTESLDWDKILDSQVVPLVRQGRTDEARSVLRGFVDG
ncbi:MAG TPA: bifunctional precorrin-2 dehydrogenase/sirohydrochlorin ferrochelatase [Acidimicrobiales bacterium]|jgi:precorrin-2 dehydrogenase/sirohydrochlorin ferrochelatase|nr:bifunctional precorrin-2 dehydrogenase/sirohydrochlorin ferrochelatase [Acidimicrobiales bacterium]